DSARAFSRPAMLLNTCCMRRSRSGSAVSPGRQPRQAPLARRRRPPATPSFEPTGMTLRRRDDRSRRRSDGMALENAKVADGTSDSAPHVAGIAAMLVGLNGAIDGPAAGTERAAHDL